MELARENGTRPNETEKPTVPWKVKETKKIVPTTNVSTRAQSRLTATIGTMRTARWKRGEAQMKEERVEEEAVVEVGVALRVGPAWR